MPDLQARDLEEANTELRSRADSLKDDKERLLRMVSRLELERHHLHSLQAKDASSGPESAWLANHVFSDAAVEESIKESSTVTCNGKKDTEQLYVGALTDLIEMNDDSM